MLTRSSRAKADSPSVLPDESLRVCFIDPIGYTGSAYYDCALLTALGTLGHEIHLLSPEQVILPPESFKNIEPHHDLGGYTGSEGKLIKALSFARSLGRCSRTLSRVQPDLVHYEFPLLPPLDYYFLVRAKKAGYPIVYTAHDANLFYGGKIFQEYQRRILKIADRIVVHTQSSIEKLDHSLPGTNIGSKCRVVPHPNYLPTVSGTPEQKEARKRLSLPRESEIVLFFGGMRKEKGLDTLLRGFVDVAAERPNALLLIAGSPPRSFSFDLDMHQRMAVDLGIADRVRWDLKRVDHDDMIDYYSAADAIALPYRQIDMSGVLLLAMTLGKAVIASNVGGFPEVIRQGKNGLLVEKDNPDALARSIMLLLGDRDLRDRLGAAGKATALRDNDPESVATRTAHVYREAMKDRQSRD